LQPPTRGDGNGVARRRGPVGGTTHGVLRHPLGLFV
jgi:hypothetical protein